MKAQRERPEKREAKAHKAALVQVDETVDPDHVVLMAEPGLMAHKGRQAFLDPLVSLAARVNQARLDPQAAKVERGLKDDRVLLVNICFST